MKLVMYYIYHIIYWPTVFLFGLLHFPIFRGRKNIPDGGAMFCCNHSGLADPVWVVLATKQKTSPWIMAKKSVLEIPVIGPFLGSWGAFGVDRDNPDIHAIKRALKILRDGDKLLIFPEGTRVKKGKTVTPKSGAVMIAHRAGVPIVPIYLTPNRKPFQPVRCIIGEPYQPEFSGKKPTAEELELRTQELMDKIYSLGQTA